MPLLSENLFHVVHGEQAHRTQVEGEAIGGIDYAAHYAEIECRSRYLVVARRRAYGNAVTAVRSLCAAVRSTVPGKVVQAGVERARTLAIVTPSDPDNLFITLTAKELNPELYIISRAHDQGAARRLLKIGASKAMSPHQIGGQQMANNLLRPTVTELLDLATAGAQGDIAMEEMRILEGSEMIGRSLRLSGLRQRFGVIIVAIKRDNQMVFNPTQHEVLKQDDMLITIGHSRDLKDLQQVLQP